MKAGLDRSSAAEDRTAAALGLDNYDINGMIGYSNVSLVDSLFYAASEVG